MTAFRIRDAARLLGVSDDTVRRWVDAGTLPAHSDGGPLLVEGADLAEHQRRTSSQAEHDHPHASSARNRLTGIVTAVTSDLVMSQVELQCGPFRVLSLMSTEAVRELGLEVGSAATAVVKATMVVVETPGETP